MNTQDSRPEVENQLDRRALIAGIGGLAAGATLFASKAKAGPLAPPPGPISSTGRTVQEIYDKIARTDAGLAEPRILVQSLPGSATALHVISQPGSYYLTGNIQGEAGKSGIQVSANDVAIDLAGYRLAGVSQSIHGISTNGTVRRLRVSNGVVIGWGDHGIWGPFAAIQSVALDLLVADCGATGIQLSAASLIDNCTAVNCAAQGFGTEDRGTIRQCIAMDCGLGYFCVGLSRIQQCAAWFCGRGFQPQTNSIVVDSESFNCNSGFFLSSGASASRCRAYSGSFGFEMTGSRCAADECATNDSATGFSAELDAAACLTRCRASGAATSFSIMAGNSHGPIIDITGVGDISSIAGAAHPWANFIH